MPGQAACARRPVTSRQRGRSVSGEPVRLTGRARVARWAATTDVCRCWNLLTQSDRPPRGPLPVRLRRRVDGCRAGSPQVDVEPAGVAVVMPTEDPANRRCGHIGIGIGIGARRAQAPATVTRMGRDRASGLGWPKANRARSVRRRPRKRSFVNAAPRGP